MTITINFPPATEEKLRAEAAANGEDIETYVKEAVEARLALPKSSLKGVLNRLQDAIAASGLSPEETDAIFEKEIKAVRAERRASQGKR